MFRIIDERGSGKTSRLLLLAKETGAIVVCSNPNALMVKAHAYGLTGIEFISYREFLSLGMDQNKEYLIDELEQLFYYLPNKKIIGYTLSENGKCIGDKE